MGWIEISHDDLFALYRDGQLPSELGLSVREAADHLSISRQAVHSAINRDRLEAYYVTSNENHVATYVTWTSIRSYQHSETRNKHTPKMHRVG